MISIKDKSQCCGCSACVSICNKNAITMKPDILGFLYPVVDIDKCVNCGLCEKVCAFNNKYDISLNLPKPVAYGVRHKDIDEVMRSRSGAVFVALSDKILEQGGVVYGAGYTDHFRVVHKRAVTKNMRDEFRGSKYVQSDMNTVFLQVKKDLSEGLVVLFSGTPCQTAGLSSFIGKRLRKNLFLVDILCHGVPSPFLWKDFLNHIEKINKSTITEVNFRNKKIFGWKAHRETFCLKNGSKDIVCDYRFYQNTPYRKSCNVCPYTNTTRPSDITLADFWGWEKNVPNMNKDNKGLSLIICNTDKGFKLFENIQGMVLTKQVVLDNCLQPQLQEPSKQMVFRDRFERDYESKGFEYVMKRYSCSNIVYRIESFVFRILRKLNIYNS